MKPLPVDDLQLIAEHVDVNKLRSMRGIITGSTGWFGSWICSALDYMGCYYSCLDTRDLHPVNSDYCIHLAKGEVTDLIQLLTRTKLEHVLFISSGGVYMPKPDEPAIEKLRHENMFLASGLPVNIARCFSFIGAGICDMKIDYAIKQYINAIIEQKPLTVRNGNSVRAYMYMADLVIWLLNILLADKGNIYNVGGDYIITLSDLAVLMAEMTHSRVVYENCKEDPRQFYVPDLECTKNELELEIYTPLEDAIKKTIEWEINAR